MKRIALVVPVLLCFAGVCMAQGGKDKIILAKITGVDGKASYKTMTQTEYNTMGDEIKADNALFVRAVMEADKAWKLDDETKRKPFPRSAISPKSIAVVSTFTDQAKADERLSSIEDRESEREKDLKKRQEEKNKGKSAEDLAKASAREKDREYLESRARDIFEGKLTDIKTKAAEKAAAPAEGKKEEKKEDAKK